MTDIKNYIRAVPDFPAKGIIFRDITTLLKDPAALRFTFNSLYDLTKGLSIDKVVGIESRGFMFGAMLAERLNAGFIPVRKPGKLPAKTERATYKLEYGSDTVEIHVDAVSPGDNVLLHDDLLATGGTAAAAADLITRLGGNIVLASFIIELTFLEGRKRLSGYDVHSLVQYDSE